jgi:hypothetical protein
VLLKKLKVCVKFENPFPKFAKMMHIFPKKKAEAPSQKMVFGPDFIQF